MVQNTLGTIFRVTCWGESHGDSIGCVIDGCPAGLKIARKHISDELARDIPYPILTRRVEENSFRILSGIFEGISIGTPISIIIRNANVESEKYRKIKDTPRPGHADLTYKLKYGHVDWRGGSRASGRTWIAVIAAGAVAKRICSLKRIDIKSRIMELGGHVIEGGNLEEVVGKIAAESKESNDTTGGVIEIELENLPFGIGAPIFSRFHADLGHAILNIPGVKSFEVGAGGDAAIMKATEFNDPFILEDGVVTTKTRNSGGVLGGITYGAPVVFRFAVKPTPSIIIPQMSVNVKTMRETQMQTEGRFDANYTPRVLVIAEALSAIITSDHLMLSGLVPHDSVVPRKDRLSYEAVNGGD